MFKSVLTYKHSITIKWFFSYTIILILPVLISCLMYLDAERTIKEEVNLSNKLFLQETKQSMDNVSGSIEKLGVEVALNSRVQELTSVKGVFNDAQLYTAYKIAQDLRIYHLSNPLFNDIFIYLKNSDTVIGLKNTSDARTFYDMHYKSDELTYQQWQKGILEGTVPHYQVFKSSTGDDKPVNSIAYILPIPMPSVESKEAAIVIFIDSSAFLKRTNSETVMSDGNIIAIGKDGQILYSSKNVPYADELKDKQFSQMEGLFNLKWQAEKYVISYTTSQINGWKYLAITPESFFWRKVQYVGKLMFINIFICMIIGGLIIKYLLKKNYSILNEVINIFGSKKGIVYCCGYNIKSES